MFNQIFFSVLVVLTRYTKSFSTLFTVHLLIIAVFALNYITQNFVLKNETGYATIENTNINTHIKTNAKYATAYDSETWPLPHEFALLNQSVDGNLVYSYPPAWPCHYPHYNQDECLMVTKNWLNSTWRSFQSGGYQNTVHEGNCTIKTSHDLPCSRADTPHVTVMVRNVDHVKKSLEFAKKHRLRLRIKSSGHDFNGRSAGEGSFVISMIHLKNPKVIYDFTPQGCSSRLPEPVINVPAGSQFQEIYKIANDSHREIVGGSSLTVSMSGGYVLGGGHSALSFYYGLAIDNVVQFEVITADGHYRIVNECQDSDLFWALKGGGGGLAIVISSTFKTYASNPAYFSVATLTFKDRDSYLPVIETYLESLNELRNNGIYCSASLADIGLPLPYTAYFYNIIGGPNPNLQSSMDKLDSFFKRLETLGVNINNQGGILPSIANIFTSSQGLVEGGYGFKLASRLVKGQVFKNSVKVKQLSEILAKPGYTNQVLLVGGGKTNEISAEKCAATPEWRTSIAHIIIGSYVPGEMSNEDREQVDANLVKSASYLGQITGSKGSYINEDNIHAPDRNELWWGPNYDRLSLIKKKYDPDGILNCRGCVGEDGGF